LLETGEKLLWVRAGARRRRASCVVQVLGHALLTAVSAAVAASVQYPWRVQVLTGIVFWVSSNAPLVIWAVRKRRARHPASGDVFFVTDRRVGALRQSGGITQMPVVAELTVKVSPNAVQFDLHGQVPLSFEGLTGEQAEMVRFIVDRLVAGAR